MTVKEKIVNPDSDDCEIGTRSIKTCATLKIQVQEVQSRAHPKLLEFRVHRIAGTAMIVTKTETGLFNQTETLTATYNLVKLI